MKDPNNIQNMCMPSFDFTILLGSVNTTRFMDYTMPTIKKFHRTHGKFTTIVTLYSHNGSIELGFYHHERIIFSFGNCPHFVHQISQSSSLIKNNVLYKRVKFYRAPYILQCIKSKILCSFILTHRKRQRSLFCSKVHTTCIMTKLSINSIIIRK